ncbi:MAG TPA: Uma2 family endonuclease [Gemmatimonadales bacterium]|jgi:Uma2 family endonuclease|nr:Uma2 family endonuclease [Gemmatimonadales bacterium]
MAVRHLVTARELERMGRADLELVRGELVPVMTPAGEQHGTLAAFLTAELWAFVRAHDLGRVYVEVGYKLFSDPDTVRGPDVSFVSRKRQTTAKRRRGFIHGVPDLAIEIASADKPMTQLTAKAVEYLEAGTLLVWVVDPKRRKVRLHRPRQPVRTLSQTDTLDGADVLPGFTLPLSRLFAELEDQSG